MSVAVDGLILILSCQKHRDTRLVEFRLPKDVYAGWPVIYVIGDLFLTTAYHLEGSLLTLRCEDSYLHLLKKLVLAIKYVREIFTIRQGILRCGDDLIFDESALCDFLRRDDKPDFYGGSGAGASLLRPNRADLQQTYNDFFMVRYYRSHPEDFANPQHNLKGLNLMKYVQRPRIANGVIGTLYYISARSCETLVAHMEALAYNVLAFDDFSKSYPYTIEDCAVSFILYFNGIGLTHADLGIAVHTNKYK